MSDGPKRLTVAGTIDDYRAELAVLEKRATSESMRLTNAYIDGELDRDGFKLAYVAAAKKWHDRTSKVAMKFTENYRDASLLEGVQIDPVPAPFSPEDAIMDAFRIRAQAKYVKEVMSTVDGDAQTRMYQKLNALQRRCAAGATQASARDTVEFSAAANGRRFRRVAREGACAFCLMLSTRSNYKTTRLKADGEKRAPRRGGSGNRYHRDCSCIVVEITDTDDDYNLRERNPAIALYYDARYEVEARGLPMTATAILAFMRLSETGLARDRTTSSRFLGDAATIAERLIADGEGIFTGPTTAGTQTVNRLGEHAAQIDKQLSYSVSEQEVREVFAAYLPGTRVVTTVAGGGAFYTPGEGVTINMAVDERGGGAFRYETILHELGHNIDYILGPGLGYISGVPNSKGELMLDAMRRDVDRLYTEAEKVHRNLLVATAEKKIAILLDPRATPEEQRMADYWFQERGLPTPVKPMAGEFGETVYVRDRQERYRPEEFRVSDLDVYRQMIGTYAPSEGGRGSAEAIFTSFDDLVAATLDDDHTFHQVQRRGHEQGYFTSRPTTSRATEAFALLTSFALGSPRGWAAAERFFPETVETYLQVISDARAHAVATMEAAAAAKAATQPPATDTRTDAADVKGGSTDNGMIFSAMTTYSTGNSKSPNAQRAEAEGREVWSSLPSAAKHGLTKKQAVGLGLNLGEWHHTSAAANRAEYFDPKVVERVLAGFTPDQIRAAGEFAASDRRFNPDTGESYFSDEAREVAFEIDQRVMKEWDAADWTR